MHSTLHCYWSAVSCYWFAPLHSYVKMKIQGTYPGYGASSLKYGLDVGSQFINPYTTTIRPLWFMNINTGNSGKHLMTSLMKEASWGGQSTLYKGNIAPDHMLTFTWVLILRFQRNDLMRSSEPINAIMAKCMPLFELMHSHIDHLRMQHTESKQIMSFDLKNGRATETSNSFHRYQV